MNSRRKQASNVVSFQSTKSMELEEKELKSITAEDKFPCYGCMDKMKEKLNCKVCDKKGYISGDHPMVKFVDDFLNKNLQPHIKNHSSHAKDYCINDSQPTSLSSDDEKYPHERRAVRKRKQVRSALDSYPRESITSEPEVNASLVSSSFRSKCVDQVHTGYCCDKCEANPIMGTRYTCETCGDFDYCQNCYHSEKHEHPMKAINKEKNQGLLLTSQVLSSLRKSTRSKK